MACEYENEKGHCTLSECMYGDFLFRDDSAFGTGYPLCMAVEEDLKNRRGAMKEKRRSPKIHELKIKPEYLNAVESLLKQFELRKDDRDYQVGDLIVFKEYDNGEYTGREYGVFKITYILRDCPEYGLMPGYCIIGW